MIIVSVAAAACGAPDLPTNGNLVGGQGEPPVVQVDGGGILGVRAASTWAFLGVPYAAPPVGERRWRPPEPVEDWQGVRTCDHTAPICPQITSTGFLADVQKESEDCLYLNVWTPARTFSEKLPVMVFIHGGSFITGSGSSSLYVGTRLAMHGAVVVTINYRLGPFGFFAHPLLTAESPHRSSGNYGLLDQLAALEWVHDNIAGFGGDPAKVTAFGESAGGASIIDLLVSPLSAGLFRSAIVESPPYVDNGIAIYSTRPLKVAEALGERLSRKLECAGRPDELAALRAVPTERMLAIGDPTQRPFPTGITYQPVVDGWVLADEPVDLLGAGRFQKVPLLIGSNRDEADIARSAVKKGAVTVATVRTQLRRIYGDQADAMLSIYPPTKYGGALNALLETVTLSVFTAPARYAADCTAAAGVPTYRYLFSGAPFGRKLGAFHGAELPYVFGNSMLTFDPEIGGGTRISEAMMGYWTSFAASGVPSGKTASGEDLPDWPAWTADGQLTLDLGPQIRVLKDYEARVCDLADRLWAPAD